jgi:hypothetical protein
MSSMAAVQSAIFGKLAGSFADPVYSQGAVPQNTQALYAVIGNDTFVEWDTDGRTGFDITVTIHTWDNRPSSRGLLGVKGLMDKVYTALHRKELTVTGDTVLGMEQEFAESFIDNDGITGHGVQRFRVILRG